MSDPLTPLFDQIRGEQLSAVTFVRDFLQLSFDGPVINVTNPLTVRAGQRSVTSWGAGFRDLLCSQIGKVVVDVECRDNDAFVIRFGDGSKLSISLREQDYTTPEALYASGFQGGASFVV